MNRTVSSDKNVDEDEDDVVKNSEYEALVAVNIESDDWGDDRSQMHVPVGIDMPLFRVKHLRNFERTASDNMGNYSLREVLQIVFQYKDNR